MNLLPIFLSPQFQSPMMQAAQVESSSPALSHAQTPALPPAHQGEAREVAAGTDGGLVLPPHRLTHNFPDGLPDPSIVEDTPCSTSSDEPPSTRLSLAVAEERDQKMRYLMRVWNELGHIPGEVRTDVARQLGVHEEHLARMFRAYRSTGYVSARPGSKNKITLPDEYRAKVAFFVNAGVISETFDYLKDRSELPAGMSYQTFRRRVLEWSPAIRACAKGGVTAMAKHQMFNDDFIPFKGYAYGTDHTRLPIRVIPPRSTKPVFPWLSILVDFHTRVILAFTLTLDTPSAEDDLSLILEGIRGWKTRSGLHVGGKPMFLRTDRGGDYISGLVSSNLIDLHIERQFTEPYSSHQNGRTEAVHRTLDLEFAPKIPGYYAGGEDAYTRRVFKIPVANQSLVSAEVLDIRLVDWVGGYNNRPHSKLGGLTPLEAWAADPHQVEAADENDIRRRMPVREHRSLHKYGIESRRHIYQGARLGRLKKAGVTEVDVKYHEHDRLSIEVFVDGAYQCTVPRTDVQSLEDRFGLLSRRRSERLEAERLIRKSDYERVRAERQRLEEDGVDESQWPVLPDDPDAEPEIDGDAADTQVIHRAVAAAAEDAADWDRDEDEADRFARFHLDTSDIHEAPQVGQSQHNPTDAFVQPHDHQNGAA